MISSLREVKTICLRRRGKSCRVGRGNSKFVERRGQARCRAVGYCVKQGNDQGADNEKLSIVDWVFLAISICIALGIPAFGIYIALTEWDGMCYGFGCCSWTCSFWEYALNHMPIAAICLVPLLVAVLGMWLVVIIIRLLRKKLN